MDKPLESFQKRAGCPTCRYADRQAVKEASPCCNLQGGKVLLNAEGGCRRWRGLANDIYDGPNAAEAPLDLHGTTGEVV